MSAFLAKRSYLARVPFIQNNLERAATLESIDGRDDRARVMPSQLYEYLARERERQGGPLFTGLGAALSKQKKYLTMMETVARRLAFGKSAIHGWGLFARVPHKVGDFVIEYVGDLVGPAVADMREKRIYNNMVGTGTYIMKVNEEHVVDATRSGNMAHLMNHSCDANCASRIVTVDGVDHPVIFAKRPLAAGEELTYDYRFHSDDERLPCNCGAALCRGFVNIPLTAAEVLDAGEMSVVPAEEVKLLLGDERGKEVKALRERIAEHAQKAEATERAEAEANVAAAVKAKASAAREADAKAQAAAQAEVTRQQQQLVQQHIGQTLAAAASAAQAQPVRPLAAVAEMVARAQAHLAKPMRPMQPARPLPPVTETGTRAQTQGAETGARAQTQGAGASSAAAQLLWGGSVLAAPPPSSSDEACANDAAIAAALEGAHC
jgi:hypothetical protein